MIHREDWMYVSGYTSMSMCVFMCEWMSTKERDREVKNMLKHEERDCKRAKQREDELKRDGRKKNKDDERER